MDSTNNQTTQNNSNILILSRTNDNDDFESTLTRTLNEIIIPNIEYTRDRFSNTGVRSPFGMYLTYNYSQKFKKYKPTKNITKYKFNSNSAYSCHYCFENFKANESMCISSCYHYWCEYCDKKIKNILCGFCKNQIEPNEFIDTLGKSGFFEKSSHCLNLIEIIKEDIDSINLCSDDYNIQLSELINNSKYESDKNLLDSLE